MAIHQNKRTTKFVYSHPVIVQIILYIQVSTGYAPSLSPNCSPTASSQRLERAHYTSHCEGTEMRPRLEKAPSLNPPAYNTKNPMRPTFASAKPSRSYQSSSSSMGGHGDEMLGPVKSCYCGLPGKVLTCTKGENKGFLFYGCPRYKSPGDRGCGFFEWVDGVHNEIVKVRKEIGGVRDEIAKVLLHVRVLCIVICVCVLMKCVT